MNILVLGHKGMLGHMLVKYLTHQNYTIYTTDYRFPSIEFKNEILKFNGDYIINCIGSIPQKTTNFQINYELPIWLEENSNCSIIHPGTDCEIDDDEYGVSKRKASEYIKKQNNKTKILKASIIGPELNSKVSLLEWFLSSSGDVYGYSNAMWNGITTLEWAKQCVKLIVNWDDYKTETILYSDCISKLELLKNIKLIYQKDSHILPIDKGINKCLLGDIYTSNIYIQLQELKQYKYENTL
jgi:dTDP-4-dehydrorhamnose reductase